MIAPRTGYGFAMSVFSGVITWVFLNPAMGTTIAIGVAMVVSVGVDLFIRWRSARRLRREAGRRAEAERDAEDEFWEDRR